MAVKTSLKYLLYISKANLLSIPGVAAVLLLGALLTGPQITGFNSTFQTYYGMFPMAAIIMVFMYGFNLSTTYLDLSISLGGRRVDFFRAAQVLMLVYVLLCVLLQEVMVLLPPILGWSLASGWGMLASVRQQLGWVYPLLCFCAQLLGSIVVFLYQKSRLWAVVVMVAVMLLGSAGVAFLMLAVAHGSTDSWGDLIPILVLVAVVITLVCEWFLWRWVKDYTVR